MDVSDEKNNILRSPPSDLRRGMSSSVFYCALLFLHGVLLASAVNRPVCP